MAANGASVHPCPRSLNRLNDTLAPAVGAEQSSVLITGLPVNLHGNPALIIEVAQNDTHTPTHQLAQNRLRPQAL